MIQDPVRQAVAALFRSAAPAGAPRTGMEIEVLPIRRSDGAAVPPISGKGGEPGTLPVLRVVADRAGWREVEGASGLPRFVTPAGGWISYEPGGQIEYASPAWAHLPTLGDDVLGVAGRLEEGMAEAGIGLLARGVDPVNPVSRARLHLRGDRYPRQRAHYDRRGPLGRVMMLQSAAIHLNVDFGPRPFEAWRAANRLAPVLIALFANSPGRCGAPESHRSQRAALWRELDPTRTGVFDGVPGGDPAREYEAFALGADSFLLGNPGEPPRPFREWLERGAGLDDWQRHLTTLFPEVRPRRYLEIRSLDALPARYAMVAAAVTVGLLHGERARAALLRHLPPATPERLAQAGRKGLGDPELRAQALGLHDLVQEGLEELGEPVSDLGLRRAVTRFFEDFPGRSQDPGARGESWIGS